MVDVDDGIDRQDGSKKGSGREMGIQSNPYRIGIVGCGNISGTHAEAIKATRQGKLVAAHSRTRSKLDTFCRKYGIDGYSDYDAFLDNPDIDIVVVCTPSGTHLDYGEAAARAGKHLIVEKPIEVTVERGRSLVDCCRDREVNLAVIYQNRFIEGVRTMKEVIESGKLGRIFMVDAAVKWYRDQEYYDSDDWRGTLALDGGGAVINQAIHTVDLMLWMAGDVESLQAYTGTFTHERMEGEDNAVAALRFTSGAIGVFRASTSIVPPGDREIEIHGEKGTARLSGDSFRLLTGETDPSGRDEGGEGAGSASPLAGMGVRHHQRQYEQILDAFRTGGQPVVSGEESLRSLAFVRALYESAEREASVAPVDPLSGSGRYNASYDEP